MTTQHLSPLTMLLSRHTRRRAFITLLGGAAAWPLAARAQQGERMRRIGVLTNLAADDPDSPARVAAFAQRLQQLGWTDGRNIRIDYRWSGGDPNRVRTFTAELVASAPDVIVVSSGSALAAVQKATGTVPVVFVSVTDPVSNGYVASLARPGANITGFTLLEYGTSGKWLELLKEIVPGVTRAAIIHDPSITSGTGQWAAIQAVAPSVGVELMPIDVRDTSGIESSIAGSHGLVVTISPVAMFRRELIISLAAKHRLPAVYAVRAFVTDGGLISYGPDEIDQYRRAAGYVDRILKGEKPADLPVQAPIKIELVINLKTAKALGLEVPPTLLARADEVIE
jgi:putative tryptophan/tyrosine transport system substrate-binding protein